MAKLLSVMALSLLFVSGAANAQYFDGYAHHMDRLHWACDHGDRDACIRFGYNIRDERFGTWHHHHPEFFFSAQ